MSALVPKNYQITRTPKLWDFGTATLSLSGGATRDTANTFDGGSGSAYIPYTAAKNAICDVTGLSVNCNGLKTMVVSIYRPPGMPTRLLNLYFTFNGFTSFMQASIPVDKDDWNYYALNMKGVSSTGSGNLGATPVSTFRFRQGTDASQIPDWLPGEYLRVGGVYTGWRTRPKFIICVDDGPDTMIIDAGGTGYPVSGKNYKAILDYYGFKGTACVNASTIGDVGKCTWAQLTTLQNAGWSIVNHSNTHPAEASNAGLRVLGPYGRNKALASADSATNTLTTGAAHLFLNGAAIYYTGGSLPGGIVAGQTYYVTNASGSTHQLSTTYQNAIAVTGIVPITSNGSGRYDYVGSADDESGIQADIVAGRDALRAHRLTGADLFVYPQGGFDLYVNNACLNIGARFCRGILDSTVTVPGIPMARSAGKVNGQYYFGATEVPASIGGATDPTATDAFVSEIEVVGGTGSYYNHGLSGSSATSLDYLCQRLQRDQRAGLIDVVTAEQWLNGLMAPVNAA